MSRINRRHLLQSSGVGLSSLSVPLSVLASQTGTKREYVSELTDSVVELLDDEAVFLFHLMSIVEEEDYTEEFVSIDLRRATLYPSFVQTRLTPEAFMEMMSERLETWVTSGDFDNFTIGDFDSVDEGVWFTGSMGSPGPDFNIYAEYQVGAYENADLVVVIIAQKNRVALGIRNAQEGVLIGDAPPFLLLAGNDPNDYRYPDPL